MEIPLPLNPRPQREGTIIRSLSPWWERVRERVRVRVRVRGYFRGNDKTVNL
jgi:hypothetical protein